MKIFDKLIGARGASCVDEILHAGRALLVCHSTALKIAKIMHQLKKELQKAKITFYSIDFYSVVKFLNTLFKILVFKKNI